MGDKEANLSMALWLKKLGVPVLTLQSQSGKLHPIKNYYDWKQNWNAFATGITGGGGGGVQFCNKRTLKTRRIQQDLSV